MQIAFHHYQKNKKSPKDLTTSQKKLNSLMDKIIYIVGSFGILIFLPQLIKVWSQGSITGVSLLSWLGMFVASTFWLLYGVVHKAKPIIFVNVLAASIQLLVVIGIFIHR